MTQAQRNDSDRHITRAQRSERIRSMAEQGYSSRQMPAKVGVSEGTVRQIARVYDIEIPADKALNRTRRINSTDVVANTVSALEGLVMGVELIEYDELDREQMPEWITSMRTVEGVLRRHRERLEATLAQSDRRCLVCGTAVTGRADRLYCGATCRQRARRAATLKQNAAETSA